MIRPFGPIKSKSKFTKLGTFDIETWGFDASEHRRDPREPGVFALGVVNLEGRKFRFTDKAEMVAFLTSRECRGYTLFAHNLSGFDGLCLFGDPALFFGSENVLLKGTKWIIARYQMGEYEYKGEKKKGKYTVRICDSLNIFQTSIEKMGRDLGFPKGITPEKFKSGDRSQGITEEDFVYCERDTDVLLKALTVLWEELGEIRPTAPSIAIHYFQRNFVDRVWWVNRELDNYFKGGFYGGRTEAYQIGALTGDNYTYDYNSLYPDVMRNGHYPDPSTLKKTDNPTVSQLINLMRDFEGVARVKLAHLESEIGYIPLRRDDRRTVFPIGQYEATVCFPELRYAIQTGKVRIQEVAWVVFGKRISSPFARFVDTIYPKKVEASKRGDFRKELWKLLLNALFGKFCEHHVNDEWYCPEYDESLHSKLRDKYGDIQWHPMDENSEGGYFKTGPNSSHEEFTDHTIFAWGAYITSYARAKNAKTQDQIRAIGIPVYYTDTDSFITPLPLPADWVDDSELGKLKLEKYPRMERINGNKDYQREGKGRQTKGVARGGPNELTVVGFDPYTRQPNAYRFVRLVRVREARRRGLICGQRLYITKVLKGTYDKRIVKPGGKTEPCRLA